METLDQEKMEIVEDELMDSEDEQDKIEEVKEKFTCNIVMS